MMCCGRVSSPRIAMSPQPGLLEHQLLKPDSEMLEVHYGEKWCFIKDQTWDSLHPGRRTVELRHLSTHDYSHNVFGLIFIPHDVLYVYPEQLALYEYIT